MPPHYELAFCITCGGALERTRADHELRPGVVLEDVELARCTSCGASWLETPGLDALTAAVEALAGGEGRGGGGCEGAGRVRLTWNGARWRRA